MDALLAKYDAPLPRYTSYPTAPHFHAGVDAGTYADWLAALAPGTALSLYVHVPFCRQLCWFCGCSTKVTNRYAPVRAFLDELAREVDAVAGRSGSRGPVSHIHWGGGTPTILEPDDIRRLADRLRCAFDVAPDAAFDVEVDPRALTPDQARALAAAGVTRASLGVQDVNPDVQEAINRVQPVAVTQAAVDALRDAGVDALNVDLMYGLPGQDDDHVAATVAATLDLAPDRIALFGYAHVPWMKRHQRLIPEDKLPDGAARARQSALAADLLGAAGYVAIGLDHFARPDDPLARAARRGTLRRNFQGYTTDAAAALLAFGPSAIGALPQGYVQNAPDLRAWRAAVHDGGLATVRGVALTPDDRLRRAVIERLMCGFQVDVGAVAAAHATPADTFAAELDGLADLAADGLVEVDDGAVRVTELGRPFLRVVASRFDGRLAAGQGRHSRAV